MSEQPQPMQQPHITIPIESALDIQYARGLTILGTLALCVVLSARAYKDAIRPAATYEELDKLNKRTERSAGGMEAASMLFLKINGENPEAIDENEKILQHMTGHQNSVVLEVMDELAKHDIIISDAALEEMKKSSEKAPEQATPPADPNG